MSLLGKYRLDTRLGGGGMAEVFLASTVGAEGFSRKVAIKRVLPGFSDNPQFAKMFVDEARISSRLSHPNIVSVLDFDRDPEGRLYLVMELVEGKDLDALASSGPLPIPVIIYLITEVLRGLGHAHDLPAVDVPMDGANTINMMRGLVHRDVSPHNVLLSWEGAVKVSDFGIAKARSATGATASVFIKGKPAYMSPEQANGQSLDGRSDLFAVGIMLWEMLIGRRLFVGEDTRATLAAVLFGQIPKVRQLRSDVPKDLERVTMKLLERDLPQRYATAEQAIHDLLECADAPRNGRELLIKVLAERFPHNAPVRHSVLKSRAAGTPVPAPTPPHGYHSLGPAQATIAGNQSAVGYASTGTMQPMATPVPPGARSRRNVIVIVSVLVAAIVAFGIAMAVSGGKQEPAKPPEPVATVTADAAAVAPPPIDAAVVQAPAPDAGIAAVAPQIDAGVEIKKEAIAGQSREKRMGRLVVRAFPVLTVYVDNKKIHDTPVDMKLPVGKHKVRLVNSEFGKNEAINVTIEENKTETIERN